MGDHGYPRRKLPNEGRMRLFVQIMRDDEAHAREVIPRVPAFIRDDRGYAERFTVRPPNKVLPVDELIGAKQ